MKPIAPRGAFFDAPPVWAAHLLSFFSGVRSNEGSATRLIGRPGRVRRNSRRGRYVDVFGQFHGSHVGRFSAKFERRQVRHITGNAEFRPDHVRRFDDCSFNIRNNGNTGAVVLAIPSAVVELDYSDSSTLVSTNTNNNQIVFPWPLMLILNSTDRRRLVNL